MIVGHRKNQALQGRCDSFVVETDVHFPTDINLLYDAIRKVIELTSKLCDHLGISEWRQHRHLLSNVKKLFNIYMASGCQGKTSPMDRNNQFLSRPLPSLFSDSSTSNSFVPACVFGRECQGVG